MIRKGLRPRFRIGLEWPDDRYPFRQVLPFRRSWIAITVLLIMDIVFLFPAVSTFRQAAEGWGSFEDLFDLVSALFMSAWLLGWIIGPLILTFALALLLFGREVIRARPGELELFLGLPGFGLTACYTALSIRNIKHVPATTDKKSGHSWRGAHMAFDFGANSVTFGSALDEMVAAEIKSRIEIATGVHIRRGEAMPDEVSGQWEKAVLTRIAELNEPETPATNVADRPPLTLASPTTLALIAANLVPLVGAVFWGWRLSDVMVLYWAESAVIGFFNVCKIVMISRMMALLAAPFFIGHFGAFMAVHFLFIYSIFIQGPQDMTGGNLGDVVQLFFDLWPALLALFASHALSFFGNFVRKHEHRGRTLKHQMSEPYSRIIFMHLVLIFGGGLTLILGETTPVLLLVIAIKVAVDIKSHFKEHRAT